jgi:hypothetical protein
MGHTPVQTRSEVHLDGTCVKKPAWHRTREAFEPWGLISNEFHHCVDSIILIIKTLCLFITRNANGGSDERRPGEGAFQTSWGGKT